MRGYLSHSKLRAIIREIDAAPSFKKKAMLRRRMKNDLDFQQFIDELLKELGYMNDQGQFEVKQDEQIPAKPVLPPLEEEDPEEHEVV